MLVINQDTGKAQHRTIGKTHTTLDPNWETVARKATIKRLFEETATKPKSTYRQLQAQCKELGLKASGKTVALEARLVRHAQGTLTDSDYPKSKAKAKTDRPTDTFGLSYRQAQKLVKWCKENVVGADTLPLQKNTGWANVLANVSLCCTTEHFRAIMENSKTRKTLTEHLGVKSQTYLQELGV
jgi:hypothetical protein